MTSIKDALEACRDAIPMTIDTRGVDGSGFLLSALAKADNTLTTPAPGRDELRERIARIIDPDSFVNAMLEDDLTPTERLHFSARREKDKEEAKRKADAILSALPVAPVVGGWRNADDIPPVPKGQMREYVVAVKRAKTGKAYEFAACYLNGYPIEYRDCCPKGNGCDGDGCDDGCPTTGWFEQTGDDYYDTMFNQMSIGKDDTFLGWLELPRWEDRATAPVVDEAGEPYLVWSNEHAAWWGPDHRGYNTHISHAGNYTREEAIKICIGARGGREFNRNPSEVPVLLKDAEAFWGEAGLEERYRREQQERIEEERREEEAIRAGGE
jgi:hypothetical protein